MEKKISARIKKVEVYITSDGKEFETKQGAEEHELEVWYKTEIKSREFHNDEDVYILINSYREYLDYKKYNESVEWYSFKDSELQAYYNLEEMQYPILIKYDNRSYVTIVEKSEYKFHKKICEMYEETMEER